MEDLEEDQQYRTNINIYQKDTEMLTSGNESDVEEIPRIGVEEMMQDLNIDDDPEAAEGKLTTK